MGTFNYGDPINEKLRHAVYDVLPFFEWKKFTGIYETSQGLIHALPGDKYTHAAL